MGIRKILSNRSSGGLGATNIIPNGNFAKDGAWSGGHATAYTSSNLLYITGDGSSVVAYAWENTAITAVIGHKIYFRAKLMVTGTVCTNADLRIQGATGGSILAFSKANPSQYITYTLSNVFAITDQTGLIRPWFAHQYATALAATNAVMNVQEALAIDLTTLFGAGEEPTTAQCDVLFPFWFDSMQSNLLSPNSALKN